MAGLEWLSRFSSGSAGSVTNRPSDRFFHRVGPAGGLARSTRPIPSWFGHGEKKVEFPRSTIGQFLSGFFWVY